MAKIDDKAIDQLFSQEKSIYGGLRNDYFAPLYLMQEHDLDLEHALRQTTFGGHDYGFDAFHFNSVNCNLYLYQFKWSTDPGTFKESYRRIIDAGLGRIFSAGAMQDRNQNQALQQIKSCLDENRDVIKGVYVRFVFRGDLRSAENSQVLPPFQEELEAQKYMIDQYFGKELNFVIEYRSERGHVGGTSRASKTHRYKIDFPDPVLKKGPDGQMLHVCSMKLYQLNGIFEAMGQRLFERNIRSGLTGDKAPNRAITRALRQIVLDEKTDPSIFLFNHNGVTISAQQLRRVGDKYEIVEPRLPARPASR